MAQITNIQKLKQHALRDIAEGREEISVEVDVVRQQLSPGRVLQRVVDRHAVLLVVLAVTAGIIPAMLIVRRKRCPMTISVAAPPPKPVLGALLLGALGLLARSLTPALMKSVILPHIHDFIAKKHPDMAPGNPPV